VVILRGFVIDAVSYFEVDYAFAVVETKRGFSVVSFGYDGVCNNGFDHDMISFLAGAACCFNKYIF